MDIAFKVGDFVEADYGGEGKWYGGTVKGQNDDGTYHIEYTDGDTEMAVTTHCMQAPARKRQRKATQALEAPQEAAARALAKQRAAVAAAKGAA